MSVKLRVPCVSECEEQIAFFKWCSLKPVMRDYCFSVPNEGKRSHFTGSLFVRKGLKKGVPDICLPYPSPQGFHAAFIEMKRADRKNHATADQLDWIFKLRKANNYANVAYGWQDAAQQFEAYLAGNIDMAQMVC